VIQFVEGPFESVGVLLLLLRAGVILTIAMLAAVVAERAGFGVSGWRQARIDRRYAETLRRALAGDDAAVRTLVASPARHRLALAWLLVAPLIDDRDAARIARTRSIMKTLAIDDIADRYVRSLWWWKRALGLRALGLAQVRSRTAVIIGALDDGHPDVRAAALDALTDLQDPASLQAIVVRMHDATLHRGRRAAALTAFGSQSEPFLLDLAAVDPAHRLNYARALAICGSGRSRATLCQWTADPTAAVRAAAFEALAHVGLDDEAARLAVRALESDDPTVRAMAAQALHGWTGNPDVIPGLTRRLDDTWLVAVPAAESLRSIRPDGLAALSATAARTDLAGALARQMLWEEQRQL
jgi:HEAT repeat protein